MADVEDDSARFANMYIERIVAEVVELTKIRLMNETRISYLERVNADLQAQIEAIAINENKAEMKTQRKAKTDNF